jgi:hypothetical protein
VQQPAEAHVERQAADPQQAIEAVAHAQRLELPRLLEQPLHGPREAEQRDQEEQGPDQAEARARAGRREDVLHRLRTAARQPIAVDDAVGGVLPAEVRRQRARDDRQRDDRGQRARRERHRAVEADDLLEAVDDPQDELWPQPERQGANDPLTIDVHGRHAGWSSAGGSRDITPSG